MMVERSRQEIFDAAYKGLASQAFHQSRSHKYGGCAYRGEGELKCAVGHLISDENYNEGLEGLSAEDWQVLFAAGISVKHAELLTDLQLAHDGDDISIVVDPEEMKARLAVVAKVYGLSLSGPSA